MNPLDILKKNGLSLSDQGLRADNNSLNNTDTNPNKPSMQPQDFPSLQDNIPLVQKNKLIHTQARTNNFLNNQRQAEKISTNVRKKVSFSYSSRESSPSINLQNKQRVAQFLPTTNYLRNFQVSRVQTPKKPQTPTKIIYQMIKHEDSATPRNSARTFIQIENQNLILKQQIKRLLQLLNQERNKSIRQSQNQIILVKKIQSQVLRMQKENQQLKQFCKLIKQNPSNLRGFDEERKLKQELSKSYQNTINLNEQVSQLKRQNIHLRQKIFKYQVISSQKSYLLQLPENKLPQLNTSISQRFRQLQNQIRKLKNTQQVLKQKLKAQQLWKQNVSNQIQILQRSVQQKQKELRQSGLV